MGRANGGKPSKPGRKKDPLDGLTMQVSSKISPQASQVTVTGQKDDGFQFGKHTTWVKLKSLTEKQLYFAKRYVLTGENAAKAARESGFSEWYAQLRLVNEPLIIAEVRRMQAERAKKYEVTADRVIGELAKVAFGTLGDFITIQQDGTPLMECHEVGPHEMAAMQEITQDIYMERTGNEDEVTPVKKTKIKLHSKVQALDQLSKILKLHGADGGFDNDTPEIKAKKIQAALRAMREVDGEVAREKAAK